MKRSFENAFENKRPSYEEVNEKANAEEALATYVLDYRILSIKYSCWTKEFQLMFYNALNSPNRYIFRWRPDIRLVAYRARVATVTFPPAISIRMVLDAINPHLSVALLPMHILDIALTLVTMDHRPWNSDGEFAREFDPKVNRDANFYGSQVSYREYVGKKPVYDARNLSCQYLVANSASFTETALVREGMEFEDSLIKRVTDEILASDMWRNRLTPYLRIAMMSGCKSMTALWTLAMVMNESQWREVGRGYHMFDKDIIIKTLDFGQRCCITSTMVIHGICSIAPNTYRTHIVPMLDVKHDAYTKAVHAQLLGYNFRRSLRNLGVMLAQFLRKQQPMVRYLIGNAELCATLPRDHYGYVPYEIGQVEEAFRRIK
jgi:hypothetical protein